MENVSYGKRERLSDDEDELDSAKTKKTEDVPCKQVQDLLDELDGTIESVKKQAAKMPGPVKITPITSGMTTTPNEQKKK
jgi:hypothetical protein